MSEFDTILYPHSLAEKDGSLIGFQILDCPSYQRIFSTDEERERCTAGTAATITHAPGEISGRIYGQEYTAGTILLDLMGKSGIYCGKEYAAKTPSLPAMYSERDKIPRIGVHKTISGYGIAGSDIIITGKNGISSTFKTDARGVWYGYLPVDDYSNADLRSFVMEGGKVYKLLEQIEREEGYIWDEIMQCITTSGNGYRMISRVT
ncbi:MAG: hypothetical protein PHI15_01780 [Methanomicrobium sp.]|nr:hypothetical protein [Methanomicrobium sp.]